MIVVIILTTTHSIYGQFKTYHRDADDIEFDMIRIPTWAAIHDYMDSIVAPLVKP